MMILSFSLNFLGPVWVASWVTVIVWSVMEPFVTMTSSFCSGVWDSGVGRSKVFRMIPSRRSSSGRSVRGIVESNGFPIIKKAISKIVKTMKPYCLSSFIIYLKRFGGHVRVLLP